MVLWTIGHNFGIVLNDWRTLVKTKSLSFEQPIYVTRPILPNIDIISEKLREIWDSQRLTNNGIQHKQLESALLSKLKVPCLSLFNNGTTALLVACRSSKLTGEVITTPFTFAATPHVLSWCNIRPVFCDIDPVTMNIDATKIEAMITSQTTGILAVHVFGTPCDVISIQELADRYGLKVIYDAAHAFGVEIDNTGIGTFGDISMFSFHATKLFHTAEGGALTFNDSNLKPCIELLKNFGIKNEEEVLLAGINGKMNEIQAALGLAVLECIDGEKEKRRNLNKHYRHCLDNIEGLSVTGQIGNGIEPNFQNLVIRINEKLFGRSRDYVYSEFKKYNIFTRKYFHPLCCDYVCYSHLTSARSSMLTNARLAAGEVLSLPFYGGLTANDVEKICSILLQMRR
jgi:dTDP-4-amino-4,6-dideoxygalactose transaminase